MHETDSPEPHEAAPVADPDDQPPAPAQSDPVLDGFESDLDSVTSALDALDADDLAGAEALVAGLEESADQDESIDDQSH